MLRIRLLGPFQVERDGQALAGNEWRGRQMRTILKILAARAGEVVTGDQLIDLLWRDEDPAGARRNLHVRISQLRHALGGDSQAATIQTLEGGYLLELNAECRVDRVDFLDAIKQGHQLLADGQLNQAIERFEAAHALYRGPFLEEDLYEEWTQAEREYLHQEYLDLLIELAECHAQRGHFRLAIGLCRQVLEEDNCREAVYLRLMLYHYYAGEQDQALRTYELCKQTLQRELEVQPLPDTVILAEQIRNGQLWAIDNAPRYPPPVLEGRLFSVPFSLGRMPFLGRVNEISWLVERWQTMRHGILFIEGEVGIGKTRLAEEFLAYVAGQGATVLRGSALNSPALPYAPVVQALRAQPLQALAKALPVSTLAILEGLLPGMMASDPATPLPAGLPAEIEQARLFAAIGELMNTLFPGPAILSIDNAHLSDQATIELIQYLASSICILLTCRTEEAPADHPLRLACRPLKQGGHFAGLKLERLSQSQVVELLQQVAGGMLPDLTARIGSLTDGNPLFIQAWLQHLFETGVCYVDAAGAWAITSHALPAAPETVHRAIQKRLERLSPAQQRIFDLASLAGSDLSYDLLHHASDLNEPVLRTTLDELLEMGLLSEPRQAGQSELSLIHESYGEVNRAGLPAWRKRSLHSRLAAALQFVAADLDLAAPGLAHHYQLAGEPQAAFEWYVRAGQVAQRRFAHQQAREFYQQAINLDCCETGPVYEKMGHIAHHLAHYADGLHWFGLALERWIALDDLNGQIQAYYSLAECAREQSKFKPAADSAQLGLSLALEHPELPDQPRLVGRGHIILSNALRSGQLAPVDRIQWHYQQAVEIARLLPDDQLSGEACFWLGVIATNRGDYPAALAHDRQALECFLATGNAGWQAITYNNLAYHCLLNGQPGLADQAAQAGLKLAREIGTLHSLGWLLSTLGEIQLYQARYPESRQAFQEGLELVETWGPARLQPGLLADLARVDLAEGNPSMARPRLEQALGLAENGAPQFVPRLRVLLAQVYLHMGQPGQALQQAQQAQEIAQLKNQRSVEGQAWRLLGLAFAAKNQPEQAEQAFKTSLSLLESIADRLEMARTRAAWGKWLILLGQVAQAQPLLSLASQTFNELQSAGDLAAF